MTVRVVVRVVIADDHPVVRSGLRTLLDPDPDIQVVGEAADGAAAIDLALRRHPDVVLMDLRMPGMDGTTAIRRLRRAAPDIGVLVLTTYDSDADILPAIEAGATGYLLKDTGGDVLRDAIRATAAGESTLAPSVASRLVERTRRPRTPLSTRELDVLRQVADGRTNQQIARALHVSQATVKTHLLHIFAKLDVTDRTQAVTRALDQGALHL